MPEIVRKYLAGLHACGFAQAFEFVPYLPPRNAFTAACEKYLTGSDFLLFGVFQQLAAQLRGKQDGANFALERNSGASRPCRFDRDIAQFADADTSRAKRFHDECKAFLFACACCREQAVIFGAGQLTAGVPEKLTLDFEEFHLDIPAHKTKKAVQRRQHRVDGARCVTTVQQVGFPCGGGFLGGALRVQPAGKGGQISAVFRYRARRAFVR